MRAKHSYGVLRLYEYSRVAKAALGLSELLTKTPRWQPRGGDTHLSGR